MGNIPDLQLWAQAARAAATAGAWPGGVSPEGFRGGSKDPTSPGGAMDFYLLKKEHRWPRIPRTFHFLGDAWVPEPTQGHIEALTTIHSLVFMVHSVKSAKM